MCIAELGGVCRGQYWSDEGVDRGGVRLTYEERRRRAIERRLEVTGVHIVQASQIQFHFGVTRREVQIPRAEYLAVEIDGRAIGLCVRLRDLGTQVEECVAQDPGSARDHHARREARVRGGNGRRPDGGEHRRGDSGARGHALITAGERSEEHTSELQSPCNLVCRLLLEK